MGMEGSGLSVADALALSRNNDGMFGGNGGSWVFFLFFLLAWGGGGFGWGNRDNGALTRGELCQDMNFQQVENGVRGIQQGLCDGFYAMNTGMLNGFNGLQRDLCTGFANVSAGINQARFDSQQCCCETNRNIDAVRYENSRNTCDIVNAIREDGALTRAQMTQNQIQDLRDRLQEAQFQNSQCAQNEYLISQLQPVAKPAYITCSPYASYGYNGFNGYSGFNGCNGFNNCCNSCGC